MNALQQAISDAATALAAAGVDSARTDAEQLAAHVIGTDRGRLMVAEPGPGFLDEFRALVGQRALRIPLQHLLGSAAFGPLTLAVVPRVPGYHVAFAERIRREAEIPTMAVGLITAAEQAESYLAEGRCDLVALAREKMWNPNWPVHAAKALGGPDPLDLLPKTYAWWLRRREEVRKLYPTGTESP